MAQRAPNPPANLLANSLLHESSKTLWIVSGSSSSGKTSLCTEIVDQANLAGKSVGGIVCPAVYKDGEKLGIDQIDIRTGKRWQLGIPVHTQEERTVGCWMLNRAVLDAGNEILAGLKDEDLIVIDELGPLELKEGCGYTEGVRLLDEGRYQRALVVVRPTLLSLALNRWPQAQVVELRSEPT